ncbi:MAG TPA: hypothetical protein VNG32_04835, partial [Candidatus Dormibacteraeota bacterium]|nr:hypothetical protein [Candidatus Dormibacteraeota bacterium]
MDPSTQTTPNQPNPNTTGQPPVAPAAIPDGAYVPSQSQSPLIPGQSIAPVGAGAAAAAPLNMPSAGADKAAGKPKPHPNSTQNSLQIAEARDGIVIMNDGSFRSVIMVKSIN